MAYDLHSAAAPVQREFEVTFRGGVMDGQTVRYDGNPAGVTFITGRGKACYAPSADDPAVYTPWPR